MHPSKISTSRWSNLSKQYDQATRRGGVIRSVFCDFAVWMASELCDAQEVIHELLGTGASQNETEYNYRFGTPPMVATRAWRILNAAI